MRRLVVMVGSIILVDTLFYAALAPILPRLSHEFGLSKSQAGLLVAAYAAGSLLGSVPAGWLVARFGARDVLVGGLLTMGATGLTFAFAETTRLLDAARFVQGVGGAATWTAGLAWLAQTAPPDRRGQVLGTAIGAAVFGAQFGPVLGAIADAIGRGPAFGAAAVFGVVMAAWALNARPSDVVVPRTTTVSVALRERPFRAALWITMLPAACFGIVDGLVPLRLAVLGASTSVIAAVFFVAALFEAVANPLTGRWSDRRGARGVVRAALLGSAFGLALLDRPATWLVLGLVTVGLSGFVGMLWTPAGDLVARAADRVGLDQGWAFAASQMQWSAGAALGAAVAGTIGQADGDSAAYLLGAALCLITAAYWWARVGIEPAPPVVRTP
jgi:predicted MFS family arabinose efflux permease